jgi:hypothetical protein
MTASAFDVTALARLAISARVRCALTRYRGKWSGFDAREWERLSELASAVDRKTVLRYLGVTLLLYGGAVISVMVAGALLLFNFREAPLSIVVAAFAAAFGIILVALLLARRIAADAAIRRGLIEPLTPQPGDIELIAKVRRQHVRRISAVVFMFALVFVPMGFAPVTFLSWIGPFLEQTEWLLNPIAAVLFVVVVIRWSRLFRPGKPQ